jgi:acetyltransferase
VSSARLLRAGILRVKGLTELFDAAETIARFTPLKRPASASLPMAAGQG